MGKGKLVKWQELATFERVFEPTLQEAVDGTDYELKGSWSQKVFGNDHPIVLELGCGKGEYTLAQARRDPLAQLHWCGHQRTTCVARRQNGQ